MICWTLEDLNQDACTSSIFWPVLADVSTNNAPSIYFRKVAAL
jgi:hypothetical protein